MLSETATAPFRLALPCVPYPSQKTLEFIRITDQACKIFTMLSRITSTPVVIGPAHRTRQASCRRLAEEAPALTNLPDELILAIAASLSHGGNLKLGGACKSLRPLSLHGELWRTISFSPIAIVNLPKFLTLVDARAHTESLSLHNLHLPVSSMSLAPLGESTTLRSLDLRSERSYSLAINITDHAASITPMLKRGQLTSLFTFRRDLPALRDQGIAPKFKAYTKPVHPCSHCVDILAIEPPPVVIEICPGCARSSCACCIESSWYPCKICDEMHCPSCTVLRHDGGLGEMHLCHFCAEEHDAVLNEGYDSFDDDYGFG